MEANAEPEVYFCDLCNTSVPQQDLDSGAAARTHGKIVGACCLAALRGDVPAAARGEGRLLPVAFVLLAAVAAATIFLDHRLSDETHQARTAVELVARTVRAQDERFADLERGLDASARSAEVEALNQRIEGQQAALNAVEAKLVQTLEEQAGTVRSLRDEVLAVRDSRPDYMPVLDRLQERMMQLATSVAELKAMPRPEPRDAMHDPNLPAPSGDDVARDTGLPPELAHEVAKLDDPDAGTRFEAVDDLLRSNNPAVLEHLLPMAQDADIFVRRLTVEGLRQFRAPAAVEVLLVSLADPEEIVRDTAWRSLKELTGQNIPFEATGNESARSRSQQRWQDWWERNKDGFGS